MPLSCRVLSPWRRPARKDNPPAPSFESFEVGLRRPRLRKGGHKPTAASGSLALAREQTFEFRRRRQSGASAESAALERGDGAASRQTALDLFAAEQPVDEARVECVARARRVAAAARNLERPRLDQDAFVED